MMILLYILGGLLALGQFVVGVLGVLRLGELVERVKNAREAAERAERVACGAAASAAGARTEVEVMNRNLAQALVALPRSRTRKPKLTTTTERAASSSGAQ